MISGASDQGNGGGRRGDLANLFKLMRPGQVAFGKHVNPLAKALSALVKLQAKVAAAIPDDQGNYNFDAKLLVSDTNAILELFVPPYLLTAPAGGGGSGIVAMQVVSAPSGSNEYFTAKLGSFTAADTFTPTGSAIDVALPWEFRPDNVASGFSILPAYTAGDIFWALETPGGQNGVYVAGSELLYMDLAIGRNLWAGATAFYFQQSYGDYIIGKNVLTSDLVQIAKPYKLRNSIASEYEAADAITWDYTYVTTGANAFVSRLKSNGSYSENQRVTPSYMATHSSLQADLIYAKPVNYTNVVSVAADTLTPTGTAITWLEENDGRAWSSTPDGNP